MQFIRTKIARSKSICHQPLSSEVVHLTGKPRCLYPNSLPLTRASGSCTLIPLISKNIFKPRNQRASRASLFSTTSLSRSSCSLSCHSSTILLKKYNLGINYCILVLWACTRAVVRTIVSMRLVSLQPAYTATKN